jgi:hypothetical protein
MRGTGHPADKVGGDPLTRASILFRKMFCSMDCRVKPGNDGWRESG